MEVYDDSEFITKTNIIYNDKFKNFIKIEIYT
jgi:hypothetical protein